MGSVRYLRALIEVNGFSTGAKGLGGFVASASLLGDLGQQYVAHWVGDVVTLGTALSAFACALASMVGATRLLFSFSRDGLGPTEAGQASAKTGAPVCALAIVLAIVTITLLLFAIADVQSFDVFAWLGTIGVLILLVSYGLTAIGAVEPARGVHLGSARSGDCARIPDRGSPRGQRLGR